MKQKYMLVLFLAVFSFSKGYSQNCISLGCAAGATGAQQLIVSSQPDAFLNPVSCFPGPLSYKQAFWQFFYSPSGGNFSQTYNPTSTGDPLELDYIVYDIGISGPSAITCPVNTSGFIEVVCNTDPTPGAATGPGFDRVVPTIAGHYYAVVVIADRNVDLTYTFTIGVAQIGGVDLSAASNCPGVLPVKLSSFNAIVNNCNTDLHWEAQNETFFKQYEVEYSEGGGRFETIATIPASRESASQKYSYQHHHPQQGNINYRLKMIDMDGSVGYSKTIALKIDCNRSSLLVYPNPVTDRLNINITNAESNLTAARLFDNNGKLVYSGTMKSGTNNIDMTRFSKGVYILQLVNNTETQNLKIIK